VRLRLAHRNAHVDTPMLALGHNRTTSLEVACPLPPGADIGPREQSVGEAVPFCLDDLNPEPFNHTKPPDRQQSGPDARPFGLGLL
jgi:hypothetical protein